MANEIYKAPEAQLTDNGGAASELTEFFIVSTRKLWIMNLITMGLYTLYWNYMHWQHFRKSINDFTIWPVPRAIFSIFFINALFGLIADSYRNSAAKSWNPIYCSIVYILMILGGYFLDYLIQKEESVTTVILELFYFTVWPVVLTYVMALAQSRANHACMDPGGQLNKEFTAANIIWIVLFVLLWALVIFGWYEILSVSNI